MIITEEMLKEAVKEAWFASKIVSLSVFLDEKEICLSNIAKQVGMSEDEYLDALDRIEKPLCRDTKIKIGVPMSDETYENYKKSYKDLETGETLDDIAERILSYVGK